MQVKEIYFSPTGGTKKVADIFAASLTDSAESIDITPNAAVKANIAPDDLCVIALPVFGGRIPPVASERLSEIKGNGSKAVLLCVYGNRAYDDALAEERDVAAAAGFDVVAAVAAVARHSIVGTYAAVRPDDDDAAALRRFAAAVLEKIGKGDNSQPILSGNRPYKKQKGIKMVPKPNKNCDACGICAENCPVGAIDRQDTSLTDKKKCISCMRCVAVCPLGARRINPVIMATVKAALKKSCSVRKEYQLFI